MRIPRNSPVEMEQPTKLDRQAAFSGRPGRPHPHGVRANQRRSAATPSDETQQQYLEYLKAHLTFPFNATYWFETSEPYSHAGGNGWWSASLRRRPSTWAAA